MIMNDEDLRDCFAMFASMRIGVDGSEGAMLASAERCYLFADAMLEARKQKDNDDEEDDSGIASVAPKRTRRKSR